jgi:hypothetical protein
MKTLIAVICLLLPTQVVASESDTINSFVKTVESSLYSQIEKCKIIKISKDLNGDSKNDLMLSTNCAWGNTGGWGNAGGGWKVYFRQENNKFKYITDLEFHPLGINIEAKKDLNGFYLRSYHRHSAGEGSISTQLISESGVKQLENKVIITGPSGTGKDYKLYEELFDINYKNPLSEFCYLIKFKENSCQWEPGY